MLWRRGRLRFWLPGKRCCNRRRPPASLLASSRTALTLLGSDFRQGVVEKLVNLVVGQAAFLPSLPHRREDLVKRLGRLFGGLSTVHPESFFDKAQGKAFHALPGFGRSFVELLFGFGRQL